jgi:hypothetical protein
MARAARTERRDAQVKSKKDQTKPPEVLGEEFVEIATSGEDQIPGATREPFPKT